jgi:hypothetical protein
MDLDASSDWVEVRSFTTVHEALFLRSLLEGYGIAAFVPNEHTIHLNPLWTILLGGVRLLVRRDDLARAQELLQQEAPLSHEADTASETDEPNN